MANVLYQGAGQYFDVHCTWNTIQVLSKFLKSPGEACWGAVKSVFLLP